MTQRDSLQHIHFIGIGGVGMSAIAHVLLDRGYKISGSDIEKSEIVEELEALGATIYLGQDAANLRDCPDIVVRSTAIKDTNPEIVEAKRLGIPILHRAQMLGRLMEDHQAICVAGSHGKTTTSSMVSLCLERLGKDPSFVVGGVINEIGSNAKHGTSQWFVAEADESDGSFLNLSPAYAIITNIDEDHLDHFKDLNAIRAIFKDFIGGAKPSATILLCADDPAAFSLKDEIDAKVLTYGFSDGADYQIKNRQQKGPHNEADIYAHGQYLGRLGLRMPGAYSLLNATAALAACMHTGLAFEDVAGVLADFTGTKRRFQIIGQAKGVTVVDDYAHHPNEIAATLQAAHDYHEGRVVAFFQPHRYSRTFYLAGDFAQALDKADHVYLLDVYPAGEAPMEGVSSQLIVDKMASHPEAQILDEKKAAEILAEKLQPGDLILVMGAGSIWRQAPLILEALEG